jgi:siroheme synthase-like protein
VYGLHVSSHVSFDAFTGFLIRFSVICSVVLKARRITRRAFFVLGADFLSMRLFPLFLKLTGRRVVLVGGGPVAAAKLETLRATGAEVNVVAPTIDAAIPRQGVIVWQRSFQPEDLDDAWLTVAAGPRGVNQEVAHAAAQRRIFANVVDDPELASAYAAALLHRGAVTLAISTDGTAPGLAALLREALDVLLPEDLDRWIDEAVRLRREWIATGVPMQARRPLLLEALNRLYER